MPRGYEYVNPINEAIQTYSAVNDLYRQNREDKAQEEDRQLNRNLLQRQEDRAQANFDYTQSEHDRQQAIADTYAEEYGLENGLDIQDEDAELYADPARRTIHKQLLQEGERRLETDSVDQGFFLNYLNTVYDNQINRGSGGIKKVVSRTAPAGDGLSFLAGLDVTLEDETVVKKMLTENRGTVAEGDINPKKISVSELVQDNLKRQMLIDEFDKAQVGQHADPESNAQAKHRAYAEYERKRIAMRDPEALQRAQARRGMKQLQAIAARLPENMPPQERTRALLAEGTKAGVSENIIAAYAKTYEPESLTYKEGIKVNGHNSLVALDSAGNIVRSHEVYEDPTSQQLKQAQINAQRANAAASRAQAAVNRGKTANGRTLGDGEKLLLQQTLKDLSEYQKIYAQLLSGKTVVVTDEGGEKQTLTRGDAEVYKAMIDEKLGVINAYGLANIGEPDSKPSFAEAKAEAIQKIKENPGNKAVYDKIAQRMESWYEGSSAILPPFESKAAAIPEAPPKKKPRKRKPAKPPERFNPGKAAQTFGAKPIPKGLLHQAQGADVITLPSSNPEAVDEFRGRNQGIYIQRDINAPNY